jgi:hypothetical protein
MKQLHTVAAVLLLFPNLGLAQDRLYEASLNIQAMDLANSPDRLLDMGTAFNFIDEICGQVPEGSRPDFTVSGAYNMHTGDFMIWSEYMNMMGRYGNPEFHWAAGSWHTFTGTCSLKPASTWVEHGYTSYGGWTRNMGARRVTASRPSPIDIRLAGFTAETWTESWRSRCENVDQMAETFRAMPEIDDELKRIWKGLDLRVESVVHRYQKSIEVPFDHEGQAVATTNMLVIRAQLVLNVESWYWYYEPELSGVAPGWQGMGGLWNNVYADFAYVEARGLVEQRPVNPWEAPYVPAWWYCVNMGPWNTVIRPIQVPPRARR